MEETEPRAGSGAGRPLSELGIAWQITRPLEEAGYTTVESVISAPFETLSHIVRGTKGLRSLALALGRVAEYDRFRGAFNVDVIRDGHLIGSVPMSSLKVIASIAGTAKRFKYADPAHLKEALATGKLSWEDLAAYKLETEARRAKEREEQAPSFVPPPPAEEALPTDLEAETEELVDRYKADYDTRLWLTSDWEHVRMLATLTVAVRQAQRAYRNLNPSEVGGQGSSNLSKQITDGIKQIGLMQEALGISLKQRLASQEQSEGHEVVTNFVKDAKALLAERGTVAICCGVRLAIAVIHFPRHVLTPEVKIKCPRCGKEVEWQLVTPQMLETYVEANDFMPEGAPPDAFGRTPQ